MLSQSCRSSIGPWVPAMWAEPIVFPVPVDETSSWHVYNTLIDVERAIGNPPG